MSESTLFVVATPIGNLDDLSPRAREVLASVDLIAAEDTRVTRRLLSRFSIHTRQTAFHEHNEKDKCAELIERLQNGQSIALVSDAGTPLVSDPGFLLVRAAHEAGIPVVAVPGPSAAVAALSVSGIPTDRFCFAGFPPARRAARRKSLQEIAGRTDTVVFYESVHRVQDTLTDLVEICGPDRRATICRELTKRHEQCVSGTLDSLSRGLSDGGIPCKGEFVIVMEGADSGAGAADTKLDTDRLLEELLQVMPGKQAVDIAAKLSGASRNKLYRRMLGIKEKS